LFSISLVILYNPKVFILLELHQPMLNITASQQVRFRPSPCGSWMKIRTMWGRWEWDNDECEKYNCCISKNETKTSCSVRLSRIFVFTQKFPKMLQRQMIVIHIPTPLRTSYYCRSKMYNVWSGENIHVYANIPIRLT
jgi:hypothetical protein